MPDTFTRTFRFSDRVPRGRAHYYASNGSLDYDIGQNEIMPPLAVWQVCELSMADALRLLGHSIEESASA